MHSLLLCCVLSRAFMVSGSVADYLTTMKGLSLPGVTEANPVVRVLTPGGYIALTSSVTELALQATGFQQESPKGSAWIRFGVGALHFGAAYWNWHEIRLARAGERAMQPCRVYAGGPPCLN